MTSAGKTGDVASSISDRIIATYARTGWRGLARLWGLLGYSSGDRVRGVTTFGTCFGLDPWSYIDSIVLRCGYYESEVLEAVVEGLDGGGVLWDVGANFGLHGLTAKKLVPEAQVFCFEPSPAMLDRLCSNRVHGKLDVQIVATALSDRAAYQSFHIASPGNPGMSTLSPVPEATYESRMLVYTERGDAMVHSGVLPSPTVLKLDVEGHEEAVLRGMAEILATSCRVVVYEDGPAASTPVKELLAKAGFCSTPLIRREATAHGLTNFSAIRIRQ